MPEEQSTYKSILKSTSLFGGVQFFQVLFQVIRTKFIAVLFGPAGIGIFTVLSTTVSLTANLIGFGLNLSSIKELAKSSHAQHEAEIKRIAQLVRSLSFLTAIAGLILLMGFSYRLSTIFFDSPTKAIWFQLTGIAVFFNQLALGNLAILQGLRKRKWLAQVNIVASFIAVIFSIFAFYLVQIPGIAWSVVFTSLLLFGSSELLLRRKYGFNLTLKHIGNSIRQGSSIMRSGFVFSMGNLLPVLALYIILYWVRTKGNLADIGYYNACLSIVNTYAGLVLTAMATDYFPKLAAVIQDKEAYIDLINKQGEIALNILGPVIIILIPFSSKLLHLLYAEGFTAASVVLYWSLLGLLFKVSSWTLSYMFLSDNNHKVYFINELMGAVYLVLASLLGYHFFGLPGLGMAFCLTYVLYFLQVAILAWRYKSFYFKSTFWFSFGLYLGMAVLNFGLLKLGDNLLGKVLIGLNITLCLWFVSRQFKKYLPGMAKFIP